MKNVLKVTTVGDRELLITREFEAPRGLVWESMSRPELLKRWLFGPPGWAMTVCEEDQRVGGSFRWEWSGPEGAVLKMTGVYHEIVPPQRTVRTERFEMQGGPEMGEQLCTMTLIEIGERTRMELTVQYPSAEAREGALASGMEQGMAIGYDRLDEIVRGVVA
ncbi:SRPBCC family protein [Aquisphaera insulae]|uniref:SRPBCC family protein n=1 Tax=Aquisphaera insulae TaxID=2712864 RepID=UPI0013EDE298|nr:SRPBCC family protein [Aquisphaera insulae]